jgi:protein-S-isoprenylcysteine O-methyltransferase Ste14
MRIDTLFRVIFWLLLGGLGLLRLYYQQEHGQGTGGQRAAGEREGQRLSLVRMLVLFFLTAILVLYARDSPALKMLSIPFPLWLRCIGIALGVGGLALLAWTQAAQGKQGSSQRRARRRHPLITNGPYRWIRHPLYTALFDVVVALALLAANWWFVLFAASMIAGLMIHAPFKERRMLEAFGEPYRVYVQETGRFIPRLRTLASE